MLLEIVRHWWSKFLSNFVIIIVINDNIIINIILLLFYSLI